MNISNFFIKRPVFATVISIIVAVNHASLSITGPMILLAVFLHNLTGLLAGYGITRLCGYDTEVCKTVSIEVGMQNSGLSVALAVKFFSPLTALPGAVFSIWHNLSGALFASFWAKRSVPISDDPNQS